MHRYSSLIKINPSGVNQAMQKAERNMYAAQRGFHEMIYKIENPQSSCGQLSILELAGRNEILVEILWPYTRGTF